MTRMTAEEFETWRARAAIAQWREDRVLMAWRRIAWLREARASIALDGTTNH